MNTMLEWQNISRQGAHQGIARLHGYERDVQITLDLANLVRASHPSMCCRDIYYTMRDLMPRGRDWTERVLQEHGYRVRKRSRSFTQPGKEICSNLIEGMHMTSPNQVWQTDITYVWSDNRWYFVSFVIDVYTRQILASHCSKDLSSGGQIQCLNKALATQSAEDVTGLIIHTDRGTQYTSEEYRKHLVDHNLQHSMAHYAWQNAYCERVNRTMKHNYLKHYPTKTYRSLCRSVKKAVRMYNKSKPHSGLPSRLSPDQFVKERNQGKYTDYGFRIWSKLTSTKSLCLN